MYELGYKFIRLSGIGETFGEVKVFIQSKEMVYSIILYNFYESIKKISYYTFCFI